jgi:predicted MFS family arabinose efflux permease
MNKKLLSIYLLSAATYFTQGIENLPGLSFFLYMKEQLHFTPEKIMYIGSLVGICWLVKPLWGFLCDNFLTQKIWVTISLLGSIVIAFFFGLSPFLALPIIILMMFMGNWNSALRDVSVDGIMCVDGKKENKCDKIQAVQWTSITVSSIIVGLVGGYIAEHYNYKIAYLALIPVYLIILFIVSRYKTSKSSELQSCGSCRHEDYCDKEDYHYCSNYQIKKKNLLKEILSYKELFTNKKFLIACLFLFLYKYSPSFGTPLAFIERDSFKWSAQWMGILGAIISVFEIIGAILFFKYCKKINVRKWLYISVFLGACITLLYLYFTPITAIVYGISFAIIGMFVHLIVMGFMANSTISGKEATSFALLCSISNLSGTFSSLTGAFLFPKIGLSWLIILSAITSFICLPLIKKLEIK